MKRKASTISTDTNQPTRQDGRKKKDDEDRHCLDIKNLAGEFIRDTESKSMYAFCIARSVNPLRTSFDRLLQRKNAFVDIRVVKNPELLSKFSLFETLLRSLAGLRQS